MFAYKVIIYTRLSRVQVNVQMKRHVGQGPKQGIRCSHRSFGIDVSLDICPRLGLLDYMRTPFYIFEETPILFFIVAAPNYFPNNIVGGFSFIHTLSSIHLQTLMVAILTNVKCYLVVDLTCISVIICDVEHLFMYLMAICTSISVFYFFNWVVCLFLLLSWLYILDSKSLLVISFANIFSHSVDFLFVLFMLLFVLQKHISLIRSHLYIFAFISIALVDWP